MSKRTQIVVEEGKYTFFVDQDGTVGCDREGGPWIDEFEAGSKALISLVHEAAQDRERALDLERERDFLRAQRDGLLADRGIISASHDLILKQLNCAIEEERQEVRALLKRRGQFVALAILNKRAEGR